MAGSTEGGGVIELAIPGFIFALAGAYFIGVGLGILIGHFLP